MNARKSFRPHIDGLPLSISVAESFHNLSRVRMSQPPAPPLSIVTTLPTAPVEREHPVGVLRLRLFDIDLYDKNPRIYENEAVAEIRQSLKANGHWGTFLVTKRPGAAKYIPAAGGNTTLRVLRDLFDETADERYLWLDCKFQPFQDEARVLGQHLSENLGRGQMRFWETACAVEDLLGAVQQNRRSEATGAPDLSIREASEQLALHGIKAEKSTVAVWRFAARKLRALGPACSALTFAGVRSTLQPRIHALQALAKRFDFEPEQFENAVLGPALARFAGANFDLDVIKVADAVRLAFATAVGEAPAVIDQMLTALRVNPAATMDDLRAPSPNLVSARQAKPGAAHTVRQERGAVEGGGTSPSPAGPSPHGFATQPEPALVGEIHQALNGLAAAHGLVESQFWDLAALAVAAHPELAARMQNMFARRELISPAPIRVAGQEQKEGGSDFAAPIHCV